MNGDIMSTAELYNRIHCWLWLYDHTPFPISNDPNIVRFDSAMTLHWNDEMLADIAVLEIPVALIGTHAETKLRSAIEYSRSESSREIDSVRQLLLDVQIYIVANQLAGGSVTRN